jgi:succinylglutamic semialdehyde dehydrogenase
MKSKFAVSAQGNLIDGRFAAPVDPNGEWVSRCPGDLDDVIGRVSYSYADIDRAVTSSRQAYKTWRRTPPAERAVLMKRYQDELKRRQDELVELIAREVGKPLWEARSEVTTMINKVDVTLSDGLKIIAGVDIPNIMESTHGATRYRPQGVMAVLGPFNFPGHLPTGHIVPALLTGNTVIFKPSEKAPLVGQFIAECFQQAGFPAGVMNLLQGEREVGRRLVVHEGVDGILFTGSYEVGTRIKQDTLQQHWKILALEMGGKNPVIIWDDADLEGALGETLFGAFVTAGQRCSATSRVLVHQSLLDRFLERFHDRAKAFSIGHPLSDPFMGPLIDASVVDRYMKFMGIAQREGCELVMRGKALKLEQNGHYVTPSICLVKNNSIEAAKKSVYQQTELFAPNVAVIGVSELDEAIALANVTQYGLVASVFSKSRTVFEKCLDDLDAGLVNWNKSTVGASGRLPFGGTKKSGNHWPAGLFSSFYCTHPVASLETEQPKFNPQQFPGLNWE